MTLNFLVFSIVYTDLVMKNKKLLEVGRPLGLEFKDSRAALDRLTV
jgi:hypothetical protein